MSSEVEEQAAFILPPKDDAIAVVEVTASSQEVDLSARSELAALKPGRFVTIVADFDIWFNLGDATGSVDETAVTGDTQAWRLAAGLPFSWVYNEVYKFLRYKSSGATYLRIYVSSKAVHEAS